MSYASASALQGSSPASGAFVAPTPPVRTTTLTERLDAELAKLAGRGYRVQWLEIGEEELVTLFAEGGDEAIRLDPDPTVDKAWYGDYEVRATHRVCVWIFIEGEVEGEISAHVID